MVQLLAGDKLAVASGARDLLQDHPEMRVREPLVDQVGLIHWYGRLVGNHHRGGGEPRPVQVLRGSNCMFRGDFLRHACFEKGLRGKGAQVNWELALGLQAIKEGRHLLYDPTMHVIHHVAPRHDNDSVHRGVFDKGAVADIAHNETLVVLKHARQPMRSMLLFWQFVVGTSTCPGFLRIPVCTLREGWTAFISC